MDTRCGIWKREKGSIRIIAAPWPARGIEEREGGRMARVIMWWSSVVLPAGERWCAGGGEMSSMIGGLCVAGF